jgi:hypothetical protein
MMSGKAVEICQVAGALLILISFAGQQLGWITDKSLTYLLFNAVGAGILAVVAYLGHDWGFLLLDGSWTAISLAVLTRRPLRHGNKDASGVDRSAAGSPNVQTPAPVGGCPS